MYLTKWTEARARILEFCGATFLVNHSLRMYHRSEHFFILLSTSPGKSTDRLGHPVVPTYVTQSLFRLRPPELQRERSPTPGRAASRMADNLTPPLPIGIRLPLLLQVDFGLPLPCLADNCQYLAPPPNRILWCWGVFIRDRSGSTCAVLPFFLVRWW